MCSGGSRLEGDKSWSVSVKRAAHLLHWHFAVRAVTLYWASNVRRVRSSTDAIPRYDTHMCIHWGALPICTPTCAFTEVHSPIWHPYLHSLRCTPDMHTHMCIHWGALPDMTPICAFTEVHSRYDTHMCIHWGALPIWHPYVYSLRCTPDMTPICAFTEVHSRCTFLRSTTRCVCPEVHSRYLLPICTPRCAFPRCTPVAHFRYAHPEVHSRYAHPYVHSPRCTPRNALYAVHSLKYTTDRLQRHIDAIVRGGCTSQHLYWLYDLVKQGQPKCWRLQLVLTFKHCYNYIFFISMT